MNESNGMTSQNDSQNGLDSDALIAQWEHELAVRKQLISLLQNLLADAMNRRGVLNISVEGSLTFKTDQCTAILVPSSTLRLVR